MNKLNIIKNIHKVFTRNLHDRKLPSVIFVEPKNNKLVGISSPRKADYVNNKLNRLSIDDNNKLNRLSVDEINKRIDNRSEYDDNKFLFKD